MFSDALRLHPNSPDILAIRGLLLFLTGKLPQSLQHLASALRLDPGHENARRLRVRVKDVDRLKEEGNASFKIGNLPEAVDSYTQALDVRAPTVFFYPCLRVQSFRSSESQTKKERVAKSAPHSCQTGQRHC